MDAIEALKARRSVRIFHPGPVPRATLETIVDCARLAATARNEQPWEFVVVTDPATRGKIARATDFGRFIANAPACVAVLCRDSKYALEDGSAATQIVLVAATALGLGSCWVAGDKKPYAREICDLLGAPGNLRLISLVAIGTPAEKPAPSKRPLEDVIHWERF